MKFIIASLFFAAACLANPVHKNSGNSTSCGSPAITPDTNTNIVGGTDAIPYSWPWQVALFKQPRFGSAFQLCAGTIIDPEWIMTAGHCFYNDDTDPSKFQVKLGVFNKSESDEPGELVLNISEIHVNPKYGPIKNTFDITLLKLAEAVVYTDHISPVCLPAQDEPLPDDGSNVFITGWGDTAGEYMPLGSHEWSTTEGGPDSQILEQATVPLVSTADCKAAYPFQIYDTEFCAGLKQGGKDTCQGDSGGPLVYQDPETGTWKQLGITSWGHGCAEPGYYGVYSKVSALIDFIHQYVPDL